MTPSANQRWQLFWTFCAYTLFVVYGSLVPLEWREHTLDQAVYLFARIPWLDLGAVSRADWVANIVLYLPLAFFASALWIGQWQRGLPLLRTASVLGFCLSLAVAVEFAQIFFAPRTVSLNDLVAETLGSLAGIGIWLFAHKPLIRLWEDYRAGGRRSLRGATAGFALAYLGLALFPFDFVISSAELAEKWQSGNIGLLLAGHDSWLRTLARLGAEGVAILPLGILLGLLARNISLPRTFILGAALGLVLELVQLFLFSGVTQGASVLIRGLGLSGGAALGLWIDSHGLQAPARWVRRLAPLALLAYLPALFALAGWAKYSFLGVMPGLSRIPDIVWLPFYFHYYSTEPVALASLLANLTLYAPLGLLAWSLQMRRAPELRSGAVQPALWAALLATLVEGSKLFLDGAHPDPTNLLIAGCGGALTFAMASWLERVTTHTDQPATHNQVIEPEITQAAAQRPPSKPAATANSDRVPAWRLVVVLPALALLGIGLIHHPLTLAASLTVLVSALWLWRHPTHWLILLPAALPVLNLAPWSGRQLIDLFDLLVLVAIIYSWARLPLALPQKGRVALGLLLISTLIGLLPGIHHPYPDASHGGFEALMVGKGLVWALLLIPALLGQAAGARLRMLARGLALGVSLLALWVLWERQAHVGLFDFDNVFRVTGGFAQMYSGGAYIEAFIALAFPALLWHLRTGEHWSIRATALAFSLLAAYAMLVTFSRGGYLGMGLGTLVFALLAWRRAGRARWLPIAGLAVLIGVSLPVLFSGFAQQRLSQIGQDFGTRWQLWEHALSMLDGRSWLIGRGLGQYPSQYLLNSQPGQQPGSWQRVHEGSQTYLQLFAGEPYYLDQVVTPPPPGQPLQLLANVRLHDGATAPAIRLCRKALLYSFGCYQVALPKARPALAGHWQHIRVGIPAGAIPKSQEPAGAALKISIAGPAVGRVDLGRIDLQLATNGQSLLENTDFSQKLDYWMPAIDFDPPWHIHQSVLDILFALGLLGVTAFALLLIASLRAYLSKNVPDTSAKQALLAGIFGILAVSLTGSIADESRLLWLLLIGLSANLTWGTKGTPES